MLETLTHSSLPWRPSPFGPYTIEGMPAWFSSPASHQNALPVGGGAIPSVSETHEAKVCTKELSSAMLDGGREKVIRGGLYLNSGTLLAILLNKLSSSTVIDSGDCAGIVRNSTVSVHRSG